MPFHPETILSLSFFLSTPHIQGHTADSVVHKLLESVLGTLKPLVSHSPSSSESGVGLLSPASEQSVGLLLELALEMGITVREY